MSSMKKSVCLFATVLACTVCAVSAVRAEDPGKLVLPRFSPTPRQAVPLEWARFREAMTPIARDKGALKATEERVRGFGLELYPKVAPCVVLVRTHDGHGTGFLIDADGWLATNNHVIADAKPDPQTGALRADIHLGQWKEDHMVLLDESVPALVYKHSPTKDLALLRLTRKPAKVAKLPFLRLADLKSGDKLQAGVDCAAIGHPAAGALWSLREGVVSQIADWPSDQMDLMMRQLAISEGAQRQRFKELIAQLARRKVVLSTCGLNPGDSGGPLVNKEGKVIAVSFAEPRDPRGRNLSKIFYHVHLDELKAFLDDRGTLAAAPAPDAPDPLAEALFYELRDMDGDGKPDTLLYGRFENVEKNGKIERKPVVTGTLVDLNNSNGALTADKMDDPAKRRKWKFQFAVRTEPCRTMFYDTDGDGQIDLVLRDVDGDGKADVVLRRAGDKWQLDKRTGRPLIELSLFEDAKLRQRFRDYLVNLSKAR